LIIKDVAVPRKDFGPRYPPVETEVADELFDPTGQLTYDTVCNKHCEVSGKRFPAYSGGDLWQTSFSQQQFLQAIA
jgi:hypothetical protein